MKITALTFYFIYFTVSAHAPAASELPNGGGFLSPCGKYIPGKFEVLVSHSTLKLTLFID